MVSARASNGDCAFDPNSPLNARDVKGAATLNEHEDDTLRRFATRDHWWVFLTALGP